jgi:tetracycline resistance efflux pump
MMYSGWNVLASVSLLAEVAGGLIIAEGAVAEEMYILAFVVLLGVLTSFIYISGGLQAVSEWAITKVRTRFKPSWSRSSLESSSSSMTLSAVW